MEREIIIQPERRLCTVNGETGYFHCWEYYATVVDASPLRGGHPAGQISELRGIVEFEDRVERVSPISPSAVFLSFPVSVVTLRCAFIL